MTTATKRYNTAKELVEFGKLYSAQEAVSIVKKTSTAKFDETIELHLRTGADPKHADQIVRGVVTLPHGVGKQMRVTVFTDGENVAAAEAAGADFAGNDDLIERVEGGWADFDVAIATPDMMGRIGRLGRHLGRQGLMPNPRTGTVVQPDDLPRAIDEAKKGRVEYRLDRDGLMHVTIGKASFDESQLHENLSSLMEAVVRARPSGVKGQYIKTASLTSTMGPSVPMDAIDLTELQTE